MGDKEGANTVGVEEGTTSGGDGELDRGRGSNGSGGELDRVRNLKTKGSGAWAAAIYNSNVSRV